MTRRTEAARTETAAKQPEQETVETTTVEETSLKQEESIETATMESTSSKEEEETFASKKPTLFKDLIYSMDTIISRATNRPIKDGEVVAKEPVFWCEVCSIKLSPPVTAVAHFKGKSHHTQVNKRGNTTTESLKRTYPAATSSSGPSEKVTKKNEDPGLVNKNVDPMLRCTDCNATFQTYKIATGHYQGKRHLQRMKEILAPQVSTAIRPLLGGFNSRGRGKFNSNNNIGNRNYFNNHLSNNQNNFSSQNQSNSFLGINQSSSYGSLNQSSSFGSLNQSNSYGSLNQPAGSGSFNQPAGSGSFNQTGGYGSLTSRLHNLLQQSGLHNSGESNFRPMGGNDNFSTPSYTKFNVSPSLPTNNNYWRN